MACELPSISEAVSLISQGDLEPMQLVEHCLERIARYEDQVRGWVQVDEQGARREAEQLRQMAGRGELRGCLHGIPIGIKDIVDVAGMPTKAGSPLRERHLAKQDAALVAQLRRHGAIILGKTVTTQFACFDPPPTHNPWNLSRTPGGSSSGSAAAVAVGMCMAAIGSQTGGSITRPASYCGVAGLKATFGGVSLSGVVPVSSHLDHPGPLARTVGDLLLVWTAIRDAPQPAAGDDELAGLLDCGPSPPKIGLIEEFFMHEADDEVLRQTETAIDTLKEAGAAVSCAKIPGSFVDVLTMHRRIMAVEAAQYHRRQYADHRELYGPNISSLLDEGLAAAAIDYVAALEHQRQFSEVMAEALRDFDLLVTPATCTTAPTLDTTGDPKFNSPWSYSGLPTVSIPCGLATDGMPCSLQCIGRRHGEHRLLSWAAWCERCLDFRALPPLLSRSAGDG